MSTLERLLRDNRWGVLGGLVACLLFLVVVPLLMWPAQSMRQNEMRQQAGRQTLAYVQAVDRAETAVFARDGQYTSNLAVLHELAVSSLDTAQPADQRLSASDARVLRQGFASGLRTELVASTSGQTLLVRVQDRRGVVLSMRRTGALAADGVDCTANGRACHLLLGR